MKDQPLRVMLVVPDSNTTMEREIRALWPEVTEIHWVGIPRPVRPLVVDDLPEYGAHAIKAARETGAQHPVDMVIFGCTSAGFLTGPEGDRAMQAALEDALGVPAVTTSSSMAERMIDQGVTRPAVVTPYLDATNQGLIRFLSAKGITTSSLRSLEFKTVYDYLNAQSGPVLDLARVAGQDPHCDGLFVACTQLPTLEIMDTLRAELGKPVLGAVASTVWKAKATLAQARASGER